MLFHGINGSRILDQNVWIDAVVKPVKDGTSKTTYMSGWHIMPSAEECHSYLDKFKHVENKVVVRCEASGIRPKEHSPSNVFLADRIKVLDIM